MASLAAFVVGKTGPALALLLESAQALGPRYTYAFGLRGMKDFRA